MKAVTVKAAVVTLKCMALGVSSIGDRVLQVPVDGGTCLKDVIESDRGGQILPLTWSTSDGLLDSRGIPISILVNSRPIGRRDGLGTPLSPGDVITLVPRLV